MIRHNNSRDVFTELFNGFVEDFPWNSTKLFTDDFFKPEFSKAFNDMFKNVGEEFYETKENYVISLELPGSKKEDIKIDFDKGTVVISTDKKINTKDRIRSFISTLYSGKIEKKYNIPTDVNFESVTAEFVDGVLTVNLPKNDSVKSKTIKII